MRRLFVYGTLRPGGGAFERMLAPAVADTAAARLPGHRLYGRGLPYPFVRPGPGTVIGDVVRLAVPPEPVLEVLDAYEGPEYERVEAVVEDADEPVWVYRAAGGVVLAERHLIPSGDWFDREAG